VIRVQAQVAAPQGGIITTADGDGDGENETGDHERVRVSPRVLLDRVPSLLPDGVRWNCEGGPPQTIPG
jgi:hypothetical protein